ncbi:hypothetical protein MesoLjLc_62900 [Mesorhizobium sp. L-8-10]|nr:MULTISPECIES: hypothetical protein [unclassified Mesorhizobium]BCH26374.1 hypothetical protein MesoLjLb_61590 [Mesorhizobium sp. L-8-3]BCH34360.1 hypothetical protein MesoLjLc_62900 [Mesorhizobium sp. L-8-10]
MEHRTATPSDLAKVFGQIAERMTEEYKAAGGSEQSAKDALLMDLREGRAHTILRNGDPVAIIAWHESGGSAVTSFAADESFFAASSVRFCRRHIRRIQALCGNVPVYYRSWSERDDVSRWFRIIGFEPIGATNGARMFVLHPAPGG